MANDVILYRTDDGESAIELHLDNGTVWLIHRFFRKVCESMGTFYLSQ